MTDVRHETPTAVAELALSEEKLSLDQLALIGLRVTPDGNRALVRTSTGEIATLSKGDRAENMIVFEVTDTALVLVDSKGFSRTLTMPG